jgi:hypothetical protein
LIFVLNEYIESIINEEGIVLPTANLSGGSAGSGGFTFQHRVTAWFAVRILAETAVSSLFGLPSTVIMNSVSCETNQSVDDILILLSNGGRLFIQCKRSLSAGDSADSEFASVINQFVDQFNFHRRQTGSASASIRPIDERDRFVLTVGPTATGPIKNDLSNVLDRARTLTSAQSIDSASVNADEQEVLRKLKKHLVDAWQRSVGSVPSDLEIKNCLRLIYVQVLDVEDGGNEETGAKDNLSNVVLNTPSLASASWSFLITMCSSFTSGRMGGDRRYIQSELLRASFGIKSIRSFEIDIEKLKQQTQMTLRRLTGNSAIKIGQTQIKINRPVVAHMHSVVQNESCIVVGEPGAGKSGVLHDFVESVLAQQKDIIFLNAGYLSVNDLHELKTKFQLEHEVLDVIQNWHGQDKAYFVLDSLDAIRDDAALKNFRDLIRLIIETDSRWRVVVSIRKYDLRHNRSLQALFQGTVIREFADPEFSNYRHISISELTGPELHQLSAQSNELFQIVNNASGELKKLLKNPFNLHLVAELLSDSANPAEISSVTTQLELLDKYWSHRIEREDHDRDARLAIIRKVCKKMIDDKKLVVERSILSDPAESPFLGDLLSVGVIREFQSSASTTPDSDLLTYSHHVLFDYAVERAILRGDSKRVIQTLADDPGLFLMIRPSIVMHFNYLWAKNSNRKEFWNFVFALMSQPQISDIGKLIGPSVAAERAKTLDDLAELQQALSDNNPTRNEVAQATLTHLMGSLMTDSSGLSGENAGPWCEFLERLSVI